MIATPHPTTATADRRPIVLALGPSAGSAPLRAACTLAERDAADIVVVSVVEPPPVYAFGAHRALLEPWTIDEQLRERRLHLRDRLQRSGALSPRTTIEVAYGDAGNEVARIARERHARLIVMGLGPYVATRRLLATGTTWTTSRRATCPVLAVSEHLRELPRVAVVATDFSPESIHAALEALPLLADGAVMHLVHAWRPIETVLPVGELDALNRSYAASLPEQFDRMRSLFGPERPVTFDTAAFEGQPADTVLSLARQRRADLIVAGTHGYGLLERWLLGSTSTALLRAAECSVLLVPPPPVAEHTRLLRHMTGTSTVRRPEQWNEELQAFVQRNRHRRTTLEIDDTAIGAQVQESGYALVGATYDPHDHHLALMFGEGRDRGAHLTRSLAEVRSVAVASGPRDEDRALCIESGHGSALLTFLDPAPTVLGSSPASSANA